MKYAPILYVSALTGKRCPGVLAKVKEVFETAQVRVQTAELNRILSKAFEKKPPPVVRGEPVKFFFATQVETAPPTFVLFVSHPRKVHFSYVRYLKNTLRSHYPFEGSNMKLHLRKRRKSDEEKDRVANG